MSLHESVAAGLAELEPLDIRDRALADLALLYAEGIDEAREWQRRQEEEPDVKLPKGWQDKLRDPLAELGPKLLAALTALQMTPAARKEALKGAEQAPPKSPLDELRAKRAERGSAG